MPNGPGMRVRLPGPGRAGAATAALACGVTLVFAYLNKARCAGPPYRPDGRSIVFDRIKDSHVCYSDIQFLWLGRGVDLHLFPYLTGGITPAGKLTGSTVEYPVLSGLLMWLGGIGAHTDAAFLLHSALLLAPFALATAWLLGRLSGRAALLWAAGPPLVLYAFHNWELPVVCTAVAAVYVVTALTRYSVRTRGVVAAVLLGIGACLKVYPGIFVLPLMVHVLVGGSDGLDALAHARPGTGRRYDVRGALAVAAAAVATVVAINLPFAVAGYRAGGPRSRSRGRARPTSPRIPFGTGGFGRCSGPGAERRNHTGRRWRCSPRRWCWPPSRSRCGWAGGATRAAGCSPGSA